MIRLVLAVLLMIPAIAFGSENPMLGSGDMQQMMVQMQKMQQCMESIDQEKLNALQAKAEQVSEEIETLCTQGKRDQAQKKAITFAREFSTDPTMQQMQQCTSYAEGAMAGMIPQMPEIPQEEDYQSNHVCD